MDTTEEIKKIVELMKDSDLTQFEIEKDGLKLSIHRASPQAAVMAAPAVMQPQMSAPAAQAPAPAAESAPAAGVEVIKSPMVGTFYRSPAPESPAFVDVGASVNEESTVCIVEAMKVMNEIQADVKGTITRILVDNGQPVEYGQPLFEYKKA